MLQTLGQEKTLYQRINQALEDKFVDQDEKKELFETLNQLTGKIDKNAQNNSTKLPLTDPPPTISFPGKNYCFTGHFVTGTRKQVESIVIEKGGRTQSAPTFSTNYLVIGLIGSTDWIHSTYGRKIERAVEIQNGHNIKIISEEHWAQFL